MDTINTERKRKSKQKTGTIHDFNFLLELLDRDNEEKISKILALEKLSLVEIESRKKKSEYCAKQEKENYSNINKFRANNSNNNRYI